MISHTLLNPHPTLRIYRQYSRINECDPEWNLRFQKFVICDSFDPDYSKPEELLWKQHLFNMPGMGGQNTIIHKKIDRSYYFEFKYNKSKGNFLPPLFSLPDIGFINDWERYSPALMEKPKIEDNNKSYESRVKRYLYKIETAKQKKDINEIKDKRRKLLEFNELDDSYFVQFRKQVKEFKSEMQDKQEKFEQGFS